MGTCRYQRPPASRKRAWRSVGDSSCPQHPGGKDPIKDGLDQSGAEEVLAFLALELQAQGFFQGGPKRVQGREVGPLNSGLGVPGIGSQKPGHLLGGGQRGGLEHHPLEVFDEAFSVVRGQCGGSGGRSQNAGFTGGQAVGFQLHRLPFGILPHQQEVPEIGDQDLAVFAPVAGDLLPLGGEPGVLFGGLTSMTPRAGMLRRAGVRVGGLLELVRGEKTAVRETGSPVLQADDAPDFGLEGLAHFVEKIGQGQGIGSLRTAAPEERISDNSLTYFSRGFIGPHLNALCHFF